MNTKSSKKSIKRTTNTRRWSALDVLEEVMFFNLAVIILTKPIRGNKNADEKRYLEHAKLAVEAAKALAPYQSPTKLPVWVQ